MAKIEVDQVSDVAYIVFSAKSKPVFIDNEKDMKALISILKGMTQKTVDTCLNIMAEDPFVMLKSQEAASQ